MWSQSQQLMKCWHGDGPEGTKETLVDWGATSTQT